MFSIYAIIHNLQRYTNQTIILKYDGGVYAFMHAFLSNVSFEHDVNTASIFIHHCWVTVWQVGVRAVQVYRAATFAHSRYLILSLHVWAKVIFVVHKPIYSYMEEAFKKQ